MRGVRVTDISPNSAAATCVPPIQINDMILQINSINVLGVALPKVRQLRHHFWIIVSRCSRLIPPRTRRAVCST